MNTQLIKGLAVLSLCLFVISDQKFAFGAVKKVNPGPRVTILQPLAKIRIAPVASSRDDSTPVQIQISGLKSSTPVSLLLSGKCVERHISSTSSGFVKPRSRKVTVTVKLSVPYEAAAGKTCRLDVFVREKVGQKWKSTKLKGRNIRVEPVQYYNIKSTWVLKNFLKPKVVSKNGACTGKSVGAAGVVNVGVVKRSGDLTFEIRGGPTGTECVFKTLKRRLKKSWWVKDIKYRKVRLKGSKDYCYSSYGPYYTGQRGTISINDWRVHLACGSSGVNPLENNNHGIRFILQSVVLMGPKSRDWKKAFK